MSTKNLSYAPAVGGVSKLLDEAMIVQIPFNVGRPVSGTNFFGRELLLADVLRLLDRGSAVNIYSLRRIGKSSLLRQIEHLCGSDPGWERYRPIYIDAEMFWGPSLGENLMEHIAGVLDSETARGGERNPSSRLRERLRATGSEVLLLVDEAEIVLRHADTAVLGVLRSMQQERSCGLVFSTAYRPIGRIAQRLETPSWGSALSNIFVSLRLPVFQQQEAEELLMSGFQSGDKVLGRKLSRRLSDYVGCYPQLVQELGWVAFQYSLQNHLSELSISHFAKILDLWRLDRESFWSNVFQQFLEALSSDTSIPITDDSSIRELLAYGILYKTEEGQFHPSHFMSSMMESNPRLRAEVTRRISHTVEKEKDGSLLPRPHKHVFVSYSHRDASWLTRLQVHLKPFVRHGAIELWDDSRIVPGANWRDEIEQALGRASVAVLLVSADFLASDFISDNELPVLLEKAARGGVRILPIVVGHCLFSAHPELSKYQSVNPPDRPLEKMRKQEAEATLVRVAQTISRELV